MKRSMRQPVRRQSKHIESLENRMLLFGSPIISEFQAINDSTLADEDGDFSDWIEIENPTTNPVDLTGWYLTDAADDLNKWQFPSVSIDPGEQLIVFASSKNRNDAGSQLHTNFKLSSEGEYLAIVQPDGQTVANDFAPSFPQQIADQSYGSILNQNTTRFLENGDQAAVLIPSDDSLGTLWTSPEFNDGNWTFGTSGIGYEVLNDGFSVRHEFDAPLDDEWNVDTPNGSTATVSVADGSLQIRTPSNHPTGRTRGLAPFVYRDLPSNSDSWEIITRINRVNGSGEAGLLIFDEATETAAVRLLNASALSVVVNSNGVVVDDTLLFGVTELSLRLTHNSSTGLFIAYYRVEDTDSWTVLSVFEEGGNGVPELINPRIGVFAATTNNQMDVDFEYFEVNVGAEQATYSLQTGLDVLAQSKGVNSSIYARMPFFVDGDPSRFEDVTLNARYDDGFIAYINGVEVLRRNVPVVSTWNSSASASHGAVSGRIPTEQFSLSGVTELLRPGENILAIHGMNVSADDNDLFFSFDLDGTDVLANRQEFFITPTPGETNALPAAPSPIVSVPGGTFSGSVDVELSLPSHNSNLEIRYTLNGNEPRSTSTLYTGPIRISSSSWLKAKTFPKGASPEYVASNTSSETYISISSSLRSRTSDLPILVVETQGQGIPGTGSSSLARSLVTLIDVDPTSGQASIVGGNVDYNGRGGLRDRGSSTGNQPKQSYTFETWGQTNDDFDVSLLGMPKESDWVLFAPYNFDRALIRNPFIYQLSNEIGRWAPRTRFIEVYSNEGGGSVSTSDYKGIYVLMEKIKRDNNRVDIEPIDRSDSSEPEISGGYIFKIDRSDPGETPFSAAGQTINWVQPESNEVSSTQRTWVRNYFNDFNSALRGRNFDDPVDGYAKYIDVDSWIDHHLLNVLAMNVDALRLSAYFYKDRGGKINFGPIWDFDRSMESTDGRDDNPNRWRGGGDGTDFFNYPWWDRLFDDPNFWQQYIDRWHELRRDTFSDDNISAVIDSMASEIESSQARNFQKWSNVSPRFGSWRGEVENMRDWLHERAQFMDDQFAPNPTFLIDGQPIPIDVDGVAVSKNQPVVVTPPPREVFTDTVILSGNVGATTGRYMVPTNNNLGTSWTSLNFNDNSWSTGRLGYGYENSAADYASLLRTRIRPQDVNSRANTFFARMEFNIADVTQLDQLVLKMKYDDGFVAYINGREVVRRGVTGTPSWTSTSSQHSDSSAVNFVDFDVSSAIGNLRNGRNILAIHAINTGTSSSDMLMQPELVSRTVEFLPGGAGTLYYTTDGSDPRLFGGNPSPTAKILPTGTPLIIDQNQRVIVRNFDTSNRGSEARIVGTDWSAPVQYDFVVDSPSLAITELNYNPYPPTQQESAILPGIGNDDFEFVEIRNVGSSTVVLSGVQLSDGVEFDFTNSSVETLAPGEYAVVVENDIAFAARYGSDIPIAGVYSGNLSNGGEDVDLVDGLGNVIFTVNYGTSDPWPVRADGIGATLELIDSSNVDAASQNKHYRWQGSGPFGGTPNQPPAASAGIVINEVLAHTDPPLTLSDSIELHNVTRQSIDIGGWYLSDSANNLQKYRIPLGTTIGGGQYIVFDESDFNPNPLNPASNHFALSGAKGDDVWLTVADTSRQTVSFIDDIHFPATANGESIARIPNGSGRLTPALSNTFGTANQAARVGPVIISEINYNPITPSGAALAFAPDLTSADLEFVEIYNPTRQTVDLTEWRIRGGVDFEFDAGQLLAADQSLVVVPFNPEKPENLGRVAAFRTQFGIGANVRLVGGYKGQLNNADDLIRLQRPDEPPVEDPTIIPRLTEDEVLYDDLSPWPTAADGNGASLHRAGINAIGSNPNSWFANAPTPGTVSFDRELTGDFDGSGIVDAIDVDLLCDELQSGGNDNQFDINQDGSVDERDLDFLIQAVLNTTFGDANLDGAFDSADLIQIFSFGQYNDGVAGNSGWASGDWNCDDEFDSTDLIVAFSKGNYRPG